MTVTVSLETVVFIHKHMLTRGYRFHLHQAADTRKLPLSPLDS